MTAGPVGDGATAKGDRLVASGAQRLDRLSRKAAARGGVAAKLADELADDAAFLRKLKPSLVLARARGQAPTDAEPGTSVRAPSEPELGERPAAGDGGRSPFVVAGAAFAVGAILAKAIDWRSHAHPRR